LVWHGFAELIKGWRISRRRRSRKRWNEAPGVGISRRRQICSFTVIRWVLRLRSLIPLESSRRVFDRLSQCSIMERESSMERGKSREENYQQYLQTNISLFFQRYKVFLH